MVLALGTPVATGQLTAAERAKSRDRIGALEAELLRISGELDELRGRLADEKPLPKQVKWLKALDETYLKLRADVLDQESLVAAGKALDRDEPAAALRLLRTGRHRAAVPLILKDMLRRQARAKRAKDELKDHHLALAALTGIVDPENRTTS